MTFQKQLNNMKRTGGQQAVDPSGQLRDEYVRQHSMWSSKRYFELMWMIPEFRVVAAHSGATNDPLEARALEHVIPKVGLIYMTWFSILFYNYILTLS
jgi:hypothetical protein